MFVKYENVISFCWNFVQVVRYQPNRIWRYWSGNIENDKVPPSWMIIMLTRLSRVYHYFCPWLIVIGTMKEGLMLTEYKKQLIQYNVIKIYKCKQKFPYILLLHYWQSFQMNIIIFVIIFSISAWSKTWGFLWVTTFWRPWIPARTHSWGI